MVYLFFFFFFNDTATTEIYTLSLHDALPIYFLLDPLAAKYAPEIQQKSVLKALARTAPSLAADFKRSEEHTSELQSRLHLVCRLLLEKKKNKKIIASLVIE